MQGVSSLMAQKTDSVKSGVYSWSNSKAEKEETRSRKEILEGSTLDLAYLEIHTSTLQPGKAPHPPHTHADTEELIIVKQGSIKITINGASKILAPSSVAMAMPGDEHGIGNAGNSDATYYILKLKSREPMNSDRAKKAGGSFDINWDTVTVKKTTKGTHRNIFDRPTSQFARFEMHTTSLNAGEVSHAPHTHRAEEIILLIKGSAEMQIGNSFYKASAGDVIFLESGILHALKNTGTDACEYFAFQWQN